MLNHNPFGSNQFADRRKHIPRDRTENTRGLIVMAVGPPPTGCQWWSNHQQSFSLTARLQFQWLDQQWSEGSLRPPPGSEVPMRQQSELYPWMAAVPKQSQLWRLRYPFLTAFWKTAMKRLLKRDMWCPQTRPRPSWATVKWPWGHM